MSELDGGRIRIRPYRPDDKPIIRRICADTGFLGRSIDPVFEDRELFADYLTGYYARVEPEASLVCEVDGKVMGYLLGCRRPVINQLYQAVANVSVAVRATYRCWKWPYGPESRAFLRWIVFKAWREVPSAPSRMPHFHINLLPEAKNLHSTRMLIQSFLAFLHGQGHKSVYGQMVTMGTRRGFKMFERYGFRVMDRKEITKYRGLYAHPVYLCTVVKDLSDGPHLSSQLNGRFTTRQ
jgi:hypothetical protein